MRTTITIDAHLLTELKRKAAQSGSSVSRLIEEAVRVMMTRTESEGDSREEFLLVTWGRGGHFTPYNIDKTSDLLHLDDLDKFGS